MWHVSKMEPYARLYRDALRRMRTQAEIQARLTEESAKQFVRTLHDLANHPLVAVDAAMELHGGRGGSPFQVMRFSPAETPGESARLIPSLQDRDSRVPVRSKTAVFSEGETYDEEDDTTESQRAGRVRRAVTLASGMEDRTGLARNGPTNKPTTLSKQGSGYVRMGSGLSNAEGLAVASTASLNSRHGTAASQAAPSLPQSNLVSARPLAAGPNWPLGNMAVECSGNFTRASSRGSDAMTSHRSSPVQSQSPPRHSQSPLRSSSPSLGSLPLQPLLSVSGLGPRPAPSQLVPNSKGRLL